MDGAGTEATIEQVLAEVVCCVRRTPAEELNQAGRLLAAAPRVFVAGAGRSGLCMRALAMRLMHLGRRAFVAGETITPSIGRGDLLVLGSGSGRTAGLLTTAEQARKPGATILLFTTDETSPLAQMADHLVVIPTSSLRADGGTGGIRSVQPLGTLFEQALLIVCDCLILAMMQQTGVNAEQMLARHANLE